MTMKILVLGASYGSLFATKSLMAGHDATLVCRTATAELINSRGTEVRIMLKDEAEHRAVLSRDLPGTLDALTPEAVDPRQYDLAVLAMQEPQYGAHALQMLLMRIAEAKVPCLSLMNMPPLPYLERIGTIDTAAVACAYSAPHIWGRFNPQLVTLCSPDPQAFRPPDAPANVLHVGLPTNFKAAAFRAPGQNEILTTLARDIDAVRLDGREVPVKLRVHTSLFVPFAKWSMLLTGNYRCVAEEPCSICDAVHDDLEKSRDIYACVNEIVMRLGADAGDLVPFEKYAAAAKRLTKPSSAARAVANGAPLIERVDKLVQIIGGQLGITHPAIDRTVARVDALLAANDVQVA